MVRIAATTGTAKYARLLDTCASMHKRQACDGVNAAAGGVVPSALPKRGVVGTGPELGTASLR